MKQTDTQLNSLSRPGRRVEATRFLRRTNRWRQLLPVDVSPRGNAYPRSACVAAAAQISRPSTNPEAKSRLRRTPARRADALVLSANAWPLSHALHRDPAFGRTATTKPGRRRWWPPDAAPAKWVRRQSHGG